ncbi:MAG: PKD domain-containing protein, partial [Gammaproteobacteria bacterium]|nr:PKD domain-containing protein [Gammaproteobacteria bacterium]
MQFDRYVRIIFFSLVLLITACGGSSSSDNSEARDLINEAPVATISSPANGTIYSENTNISFVGTGTDEEDGNLNGGSLEWSSSVDGLLGNDTTISTTLSTGTHTVTLTSMDSDGSTGSSAINITVNAAPVVGSVSVNPSPVSTGASATFSWSASDAEGDVLICHLDVDADGTNDYTINDCANNTSRAHTYTVAGNYQARLIVSDGINPAVQQNLTVTAIDAGPGNSSPQISSFVLTPTVAIVGVASSLDWTVNDVDGDTLTCFVDADGDGTDDYTINDCANNTSQTHTYSVAG